MSRTHPLVFNIRDLPSQGIRAEGDVEFSDLGLTADDPVRFPNPMHFTLHISPVQNQVLVRGELSTIIEADCDRCLETVEFPIFTDDVCHYLEDLESFTVDLTEELREDILLVLPQVCLCDDDCRGLCPQCGQNLNDEECSCDRADTKESPWDQLDGLDLPDQ